MVTMNQAVGMMIAVLTDLGILPIIQGMILLIAAVGAAKYIYGMRS